MTHPEPPARFSAHALYWLGGSPCSGKSTAAARLASRHGLVHYKCDDHFDAHLTRGHADGLPVCSMLKHATTDAIFLRSHAENLALAWDVYHEMFRYILEDVSRMASPVIVEGAQLQSAHLAALSILAAALRRLEGT